MQLVLDDAVYCYGCGVKLSEDESHELGDKVFCLECRDNYEVCEDCRGIFHIDDLAARQNGDLYCTNCLDNRLVNCICCGNSFDQAYEEGRGDSWGDMCRSCANEHFVCDSCEETLHNDEYGGNGLCCECYREREEDEDRGPLRPYHDRPGSKVFHPDRHQSLYFGVELETDNYNYSVSSNKRARAAQDLLDISNDEELFWLENDSSLDNGIELITQPCTLDYHRRQFPWGEIMEVIVNHGGKGEDTETAALHIHFNRNFFGQKHPELYQLRLVYLFEKFRDELLTLGRTSEYLMQRSAKNYGCTLHDVSAKDKIAELEGRYDRLYAVNLTNRETIEIRIFRSTLKVNVVKASLELVDFLVRLAKSYSTRKLQRLTWKDLLNLIDKKKYCYLPTYIKHCTETGVQKGRHPVEPRRESEPIPYVRVRMRDYFVVSTDRAERS